MNMKRKDMKRMFEAGFVVLLMVLVCVPLVSVEYGQAAQHPQEIERPFVLPPWGGGMVHCTPEMSDNIRLPVPVAVGNTVVKKVWHRNDLPGEQAGCIGNGVAGNSQIAACTFNDLLGRDNLVLYDYDGHHIWSSGRWGVDPWGLNLLAASSTPMVDIRDRVVACDNQKIILVNASDHDHVVVEWVSEIPHDGSLVFPIPFSPNIVANRTIILPTNGGPLLAYDVKTGVKIAEKWLGEGEVINPYYGVPRMSWADFLLLLADPSSPYQYNSQEHMVEWVSAIPYGVFPMNHVFFNGNIMFTTSPDGFVNAINTVTWSVLASNRLGDSELISGGGYFSTINSACVQGNRVYLVTEYQKPESESTDIVYSRLYAVDVHPNAPQEADRLTVAWYYPYIGRSQASPTLIGDTIYFDAYQAVQLPQNRDPHVYAVYTNGTEKWVVSYPNVTWFSFSMDPRGGFWYEDSTFFGGRKLVRFSEEDGSILDEIFIDDLVPYHSPLWPYYPNSCMTMCGSETNPVLLISANQIVGKHYLVAVDLTHGNAVLWRVLISSFLNFPGGQFTILMNGDASRVLFGTYLDGLMAVGVGQSGSGSIPSGQQSSENMQGGFIGI
ncbi:MAG: hypothetical protein V1726_00900 [Methanobacteriota archaeon]